MKGSVAGSVVCFCALVVMIATGHAVSASAGEGQRARPAAVAAIPHTHSTDAIASRILASHNAERARLGLAPLLWNRHLEEEAGEWAQFLGSRGVLEHAPDRTRNGTGENLWMGTAGAWNVEGMVEMFLDERRLYRHGSFPDISRTGNWADVGHYSQIVWKETREVGCAVRTDRGNDVLVCRYWPAGNVWGARAY